MAAQVGVHIHYAQAFFGTRRNNLDMGLRVLRQQSEQLNAGIAGPAYNANLDHLYIPNRLVRV